MSTTDSEFRKLLSACTDISSLFPDGVVYIGDIAIYIHTINQEQTASLAEFTHDADFYISIADMSDLRDMEEVTPNRRLSKHQLIKNGFEFDIYTERYSSLIVPYDQVRANAIKYDMILVACLEHLLVLKLEALKERIQSKKGSKDAQDILRITQVSSKRNHKLDATLLEGYISDEHLDLLRHIKKGSEPLSLAKGNARYAKQIRQTFSAEIDFLIE
jgi:hypothetical protein